jgi:hypothetical protein
MTKWSPLVPGRDRPVYEAPGEAVLKASAMEMMNGSQRVRGIVAAKPVNIYDWRTD